MSGVHFGPTCGGVAYWRANTPGKDGGRRIAVNLRLAEPGQVGSNIIDHFDGPNPKNARWLAGVA
ncbi:hypothetical protein [Defluviicoccus vanus]|uniref:Uncharacterized protein n=1 Tax=Defluviicoccus vanus TaxID=111831 RepID=A0A7H1N398_9PROT|nr:hypothetical protein [Defluviicoccus vanus]QNT70184.1 hypothetical protein HQ394_13710 [Defluviicoccus vanus]